MVSLLIIDIILYCITDTVYTILLCGSYKNVHCLWWNLCRAQDNGILPVNGHVSAVDVNVKADD